MCMVGYAQNQAGPPLGPNTVDIQLVICYNNYVVISSLKVEHLGMEVLHYLISDI